MSEKDDSARFTIRDTDDAPDALYMADAENLRIEKLSTRITLVAILIPCLLVIVLVIAYLDIKNRVINTQNTGSMGVQNLSKDLESRFSSLSLKQAKIEEQLASLSNAMETATAGLQVNLKKATSARKALGDAKADRSELKALSNQSEAALSGFQKKIDALQTDLKKIDQSLAEFDEELSGQILVMAEGIQKDHDRLEGIDSNIRQLEAQKLSKASLELTLGLERLALQEMVKDKLRAMEQQLTVMDRQIDELNQRLAARPHNISTPAPQPTASPEQSSQPNQQPSESTGIVEQTID